MFEALMGYPGGVPDNKPGNWAKKTPSSVGRARFMSGAIGDKIYAFGGYTGSGYLNDLVCYDSVADAWSQKSYGPAGRLGGFSGAMVKSTLTGGVKAGPCL